MGSERVEIRKGTCGGAPVIRGTRIPVAIILEFLADGESWDSILKGYPEISRDDIQAAIDFAAKNPGKLKNSR